MAAQAKNTMELLEAIHMSLGDIIQKLEKPKPKHGQKDGYYDGPSDNTGGSSRGIGALLSGKGSISKSAFGNAGMASASLAEVGKGLLALSKVGKPKKVGEYLEKVAEFVEKMTKFAKGFDKSKTKDSIKSMKDFGEGLSTLLKTITLRKLFTLKMAGLVMNKKTGKKIGQFYSSLVKHLKKGVSRADRKFMRAVADLTNGIWKILLVLVGAIVILTILVSLNLKATLIALGIVTVLLGIVIGAFILIGKFMTSKDGKKAHKGLKEFSNLVKAMALLMGTIIVVGLVAYFIPIEALALGIGIMFAVLLSIWGLSLILNKANGEGKGKDGKLVKAIWAYIALLAAVTAVLFALRWMVRNEEEMQKTLIAGAILIGVMALLLGVAWALNALTRKLDIKTLLKGMGIILGLAAVIFAVTWLIYQSMQFFKVIAEYGWDKYALDMLYMAAAILIMGVVVYAIGSVMKKGKDALAAGAGAATVIALAGLIWLTAWLFTQTIEYFRPIDEYGWGNFEINILWMQLILLTAALMPALLGSLEVYTGGTGALAALAGIITCVLLAAMLPAIALIFVATIELFLPIDEYGWGNFEINVLWMSLILLTAALIPTLLGALEVATEGIGAVIAIAGIATAIALAGLIWLITWIFVQTIPLFEEVDRYGWGYICINVLWMSLILLEVGVLVTITGIIGTLVVAAVPGIAIALGVVYAISWALTEMIPYFEQIDRYGWGEICQNILWMSLILLEIGTLVTITGVIATLVIFAVPGIAIAMGVLFLISWSLTQIIPYFEQIDEYGWGEICQNILWIGLILLEMTIVGIAIGVLSIAGVVFILAAIIGVLLLVGLTEAIIVLFQKIMDLCKLMDEADGMLNMLVSIFKIMVIILAYGFLIGVIAGVVSAIGGLFAGLGHLGMIGLHAFQDDIYTLISKIIDCARLIEENGGWDIGKDIVKIGAFLAEYAIIVGAGGSLVSVVGGIMSFIGEFGVEEMMEMQDAIHKLIKKVIETADLVRSWEEAHEGQTINDCIIKIGKFLDLYEEHIASKGSNGLVESIISFFTGSSFEDMYEDMKNITKVINLIMDLADELDKWYKAHEDSRTIQEWLKEVGSILDTYDTYVAGKGGDGGGLIESIINFFAGGSYEDTIEEMRNIAKMIDIIADLASSLYKWYREHPGSRPIANWLKEVGNMLSAYQSLKFQPEDNEIDLDYLKDSITVVKTLGQWTKACFTMLGYVSAWIKSTPGVDDIDGATAWLKSYFNFCNNYVDSLNDLGSHIEHDYDSETVTTALNKLKINSKQLLEISNILHQIMEKWPIKKAGIFSSLTKQSDEDDSVRIQTIMNNLAEAIIIWGTKDFTKTNENISNLTPTIVNNITSIIDILKQSIETTDNFTKSLDELGTKFDEVLIKHKDERVQALEEVRQSFDKVSESIDKVKQSMEELGKQDFETLSNNIQMVAESFMKAFEEWNATNATANPEEFNEYASQAENEGTNWRDKSTANRNAQSEARTQGRNGGTTIINQGQQGGYQGSRNITVWFGAKAMHGRFEVG